MRTLVLGGVRSGKSAYAERLVGGASRVRYVATGSLRHDDPQWTARIRAHRDRRPASWRTVECGATPLDLPRLLREAADGDTILVDDLGCWVTAVHDTTGWRAGTMDQPLGDLVAALTRTAADVALVSPEVGLAPVPAHDVARLFTDALGTVNRAVADVCEAVVLVVAGQPLWIKGGPGTNLGA